jgi:hypothetical protein
MRIPLVFACSLILGCGSRTLDDDPFLQALADGGAKAESGDEGGTTTPDGGGLGSDDGVVEIDAGPPVSTSIACGSATCDATTQECCVSFGGGGGGAGSAKCTAKGACTGGVALPCTGPSNCEAGQVCCLSAGGPGSTPSAKCAPTCTGRNNLILCSSDADCVAPSTCQRTMSGFGACRNRPPGG